MDNSITGSYSYYKSPINIKIADKEYKNVYGIDTRHFIDGDNVAKTINDINAIDARYVCIANDKNVEYSSKEYHNPVSRTIGGKRYNNIYSNYIDKSGSKVYEMYNGIYNKVIVKPDGEVIDYNELSKKMIKERLTKPFKKIMQLVIRK